MVKFLPKLIRRAGFGNCLAAGLLVVAAGLWNLQSQGPVQAEVRERPREAFKSGGERSEIVLREVLATLNRIDSRLERFENAMRAAAQQPLPPLAPANPVSR
jgi:hypothetical protein